jgi:predicted transposase YbfD/YdcC
MSNSSPEAAIATLASHFESLRDPRVAGRSFHPFLTIVVGAMVAVLGGAQGWDAMADFVRDHRAWFAKFADVSQGTPSADTFRRVLAALQPRAFAACVEAWVQSVLKPLGGEIVAFDGKALRGAQKRSVAWLPSALHRVHIWASKQRLLLAQEAVEGAPNEPAALLALLKLLDVKGAILTGDAQQCNKAVAQGILEAGAGYLLGLKANRSAMHRAVKGHFERLEIRPVETKDVSFHQEVTNAHGRTEIRRAWSIPSAVIEGLDAKLPGLQSASLVERTRLVGGKVSRERFFYLASLPPNAATILDTARTHWTVENSLHWVLDVQMDEDACAIHAGNGAQNVATLRGLALMLLKRDTSFKAGIARKQARVNRNTEYREHVLTRIFTEV